MVPFFDINNNFAVNHLPQYKRLPKWIQTIRGYVGELAWVDSIFRKFMNGSDNLDFYNQTITYAIYDKIKDNFSVYESLIDNNFGNPTSNINSWTKILDSFISKSERVTYVCRQLQLEYALNHYFIQQILNSGLIGYKQPNEITGNDYFPKSDIFIQSILPQFYSIIGFDDLHIQNSIYDNSIGYYAFLDLIFANESFYQYSINIPISVYNSLGITNSIRDNIVRKFIDQINVSGCQYIIITY